MDSVKGKVASLKARQAYRNHWQVALKETCWRRPGYCFLSCFCGPCVSYGLRKQALHGDMSRYICCNGLCPCSGRCGERSCPGFCLAMEVFFCTAQSVATTRWMIQDELQVETTPCDNCLIGTMIALQYVSCLCHLLACFFDELRGLANVVDMGADLCWCTVCACMQTQHKVELDHRDAHPHNIPPPLPGMHAPGVQMISIGGQPTYGAPHAPHGGAAPVHSAMTR